MQQTIITIARELGKVIMFIFLWAFPLWLSYEFNDDVYLWFLALSVVGTALVFTHYEDLERVDKLLMHKKNEGKEV